MTARPSPLPVEENIPSAPEPVHSRARLAKHQKPLASPFSVFFNLHKRAIT
jgi:hypothetical protein